MLSFNRYVSKDFGWFYFICGFFDGINRWVGVGFVCGGEVDLWFGY